MNETVLNYSSGVSNVIRCQQCYPVSAVLSGASSVIRCKQCYPVSAVLFSDWLQELKRAKRKTDHLIGNDGF